MIRRQTRTISKVCVNISAISATAEGFDEKFIGRRECRRGSIRDRGSWDVPGELFGLVPAILEPYLDLIRS